MKFRTAQGMTEFNKRYISAWTEHEDGTDVFLLCGSIFTVIRLEREMFSSWMRGELVE